MVNATAAPQLILLLMTDQFRQDAFTPEITPNLYHTFSLDPHATTFSNAYVSTPICTPARAGLLTGKSPWAHGMLGYAYTVNCSSYPTTLPQVLQDMGGYETFSVGKNHFGWHPSGEYAGQGYQHRQVYDALTRQPHPDEYMEYWDNLHPGVDPLSVTCEHGLTYNEWRACPYGGVNESEHPTPWTTRQALKYLNSFDFSNNSNQKMFLKVSYHRPHSPYDPPARLLDKRLQGHVPKRFINNTSWDIRYANSTPMGASDWFGDPGDEVARHSRAGYLASCEFVDEGMGTIFQWLKEHGLWDSSLIIWTTDHGDMNGDHNMWRKGYPYEGSSHVNLVVKVPAADGSSNTIMDTPNRSPALVETRDIAVTIYDYLGLLGKVKQKDPLVNGKSLIPIVKSGGDVNHQVRSWLDLELATQYRADIQWNAIVGRFEFTDDGGEESCGLWKYIYHVWIGQEQLFCLTRDPWETYDLSKVRAFSPVTKHWRDTMIHQFETEQRGERWVKNGHLVVGRWTPTLAANFPCKNDNGGKRDGKWEDDSESLIVKAEY
ncbi:acetylglucosamine-6-sulfatase [Seminavis robusta]|uniref:Acetylglucosamine-6-sulfatase n=1 Tax=Seminavis robusta TaxID=568900 RepID=A0A9N8DV16_9STRA|nr:acetylglucosamine-6-sulfatase [Seminavis robusta]|eukprot:Sro373_g128940.1 acetylglucosamine-6-sulfatase (546) ;mRNA; f:6826-8555